MSSRCKNCGGSLIYDISAKKVKCEHCDSFFEPEVYAHTSAQEFVLGENRNEKYESTVFLCPSCGAEIASTEQSALDYCLYCGSFVTLESRMERIKSPELIIPFSKTKEECKETYRRKLKKKLYAPKEFRDEQFVEGFKGIYIPFWNYEYTYGPEIHAKGESETRKGDYIHKQEYNITCETEGAVDNVTFDASSTFDDGISARIAPYERAHMKPFLPSYMFGFFGDIADIEEKVYQEDADELAGDKIWNMFKENPEIAKGHPAAEKPETLEKDFNIKKHSVLTMLPVWFLTWRKGDRVAYSVMNGDTGEMYSEIPVDIFRYLLFSLITALPVYGILNAGFTFSAKEMLTMAMILSFVMLLLYSFQLDKIVRKVMHSDDRGFLSVHEEAQKANESVSSNFLFEAFALLVMAVKELKFYLIILIWSGIIYAGSFLFKGVFILTLLVPLYIVFRIYKAQKVLKDMTVWIDCCFAFAALIASAMILFTDPAPDFFYYYAAVFCMAGVGFSAVGLVQRYNQLITRPVPHFFDRKKGE